MGGRWQKTQKNRKKKKENRVWIGEGARGGEGGEEEGGGVCAAQRSINVKKM